MDAAQFAKISNYLTHPLVLVGFILFLLFGLFQLVIKAGLIPQLTQTQGANVLNMVISQRIYNFYYCGFFGFWITIL